MNIKVLSLTRRFNTQSDKEYCQSLAESLSVDNNIAEVTDSMKSVFAIDFYLKNSAKENPDYIVITEALGEDSEKDFRKLFSGIISRGERFVQEKPYEKPKTTFQDRLNSLKKTPEKIKKLFDKNREKPEIPEIPYNKKKTQIFSLEASADGKKAYTFPYCGTRVLVLSKGITTDEIPSLLEKACEKFNENEETYPNGYRLIPRVYRVLNFRQRYFPIKSDPIEEKIRKTVLLGALCTFFVAGILFVYNMYVLPMQNDAIQSDIQTIFHQEETTPSGKKIKTKKKKNWKALKKINSDIQGWIQINNTKIDYPILWCKSDNADNQFYLYHDYRKYSSGFGSIFIDYRSKKGMNSRNVVIHGHHMIDGSMFANLIKYGGRGGADMGFYRKSPTVQISTPKGGTETYKIFSVFKSNVNPAQGEYFDFYCGSFKSSAQYMNYLYNLRIRSLINTPVTLNEKDKIITLVTCSYEFEDFRTVVVARKCRKGESPTVAVKEATANNSAVWPQCYYSRNGGTRPVIKTFKEVVKAHRLDWYDGDFKLKGNEELPTTYTIPTTEEETIEPVFYKVKIYNKGKCISTQKIKEKGRVRMPKIKKTYKKGKYKYTFKKWRVTPKMSLKKVKANMKIVAVYKRTKLPAKKPVKPKPTKPKPTKPKPTKPVVKPSTAPPETKPTVETTEPSETAEAVEQGE